MIAFDVDKELLALLNDMVQSHKLLEQRLATLEIISRRRKDIIEALYADIARLRGEFHSLQRVIMNVPGESE